MEYSIQNNSNKDMESVTNMAGSLLPYAQKRLGYNRPVSIVFESDFENSENILGKTAYYNPSSDQITIFVDQRHPKDILRSISHELVHHTQNCRGEFDGNKSVGEGYAQVDEHLREMEREAYLEGQLLLRDWEDGIKKENSRMNEQKVRELARSILKKLNEKFDNKLVLKQEEQQIEEEDISETEAVEEEVIEEEEVVEEDSQNENLNESFTSKKEQRLFKALMGKWCK